MVLSSTQLFSKWFLILLLSSFLHNLVFAQPFVLNDQNKNQNFTLLNRSITLFDASDQSFSLSGFLQNQHRLIPQKINAENASISFTNHYYWMSFVIQNSLPDAQIYYLETARPITDQVDLYAIFETGDTTLQLNGDARPYHTKDYNHHKSLFKLTIPANNTVRYHLHLKSDGEVINLDTKLMSADKLIANTYNEQLAFGFFYGVLFLAAITFLFFYFAIKEKTFVLYTLYVASVGLLHFSLDGYFHRFISPGGSGFGLKAVLIFASLTTLFLTVYVHSFLKIDKYFNKIKYGYKGIVIFTGLFVLLVLVLPQIPSFGYLLINAVGLISLGLILFSLGILAFRKVKVDPFFIMGIFFLVMGFTVFILCNFGVLPNTFVTVNSSKIGTGFEVIFLSLSMANLIRKLRNEKEMAKSIALKKSEDMNELKTYFMSNVSHELRTPLNAIMGMTDVLLKENKDEHLKPNIEIIKYSSLGLLSSVNDILDFGNIERGQLHLDNAPFETAQLFDEFINHTSKFAQNKGLSFNYSISHNLPGHLVGDCMRLKQIINNVIGNAIKFTPKGKINVSITSSPIINNTIHFTLCVTDSGVGIPKDKMDSIYDSFMQESINNKRKFGGLGLGLSIVKNLVDLHQGTINLTSELGKGTTCSIVLPLQIAPPPPPEALLITTSKRIEDLYILVVEDNVMNQMILKMILKKVGNPKHDIANNGEECMQLIEKNKYDIILMDLQMPVMDGYEATIAIRSGKAGAYNQQLPIIAVTADAMDGTEKRTREIGMDDYITKPIDADKLQQAILKLTADYSVVLN